MHDTKLLFLLHAPPLECNSCALANLTHHWGESPDLTFVFMTIHDKTPKPQDLPMTWDDQPFYFWRQLNAHFTYNLGSPAFKFIEKQGQPRANVSLKDCFSGIYVWKKGIATHSQSITWALLVAKFMPWKSWSNCFAWLWALQPSISLA